jgi:aminoglycoside phosphotransferase (APT) family kinase protein
MRSDLPLVATPILTSGERLRSADLVAHRVASELGLDEPRRERASMNAVYRSGPCAIRVALATTDPVVATSLARRLTGVGIEVPSPFVERSFRYDDVDGDLWATVWDFVETDPATTRDWLDVGRMVRVLHSSDANDLASSHPLPRSDRFPWWRTTAILDDLTPIVDSTIVDPLRRANDDLQWVLDRLRERSTEQVVVHGDLHPGNVRVNRRTGRALVFDWDLLSTSHPGWDHAALLHWHTRWGGEAGVYAAFAEGYGRDLTNDALTRGIADLRLLVATLMRVGAAITDESARSEANKRVGFWVGRDERPWNAV